MSTATENWYVPFKGNWRDPRRWRNEMRRSPQGVARALVGLGRLLPDHVAFGTNWCGHQLCADLSLRRERWRILETGAMASLLPSLEDYTSRLVDHRYLETCAELRAGILLLSLGFRLVRDPANALHPRKARPEDPDGGPDWLAFRERLAFGVEVICPRESDDIFGLLKFLTHATFSAMSLLQGRDVSISFDPPALRRLTNGSWFNAERTESMLLELLVAASATGSARTELGSIEPAKPGFGTMIGPVRHDEEHELQRLYGQLVHKAGQLRKLPHPGIIVLDSSQDSNSMRRCCAISSMLRDGWDTWAANVACVMLVASTWPGFALTLVAGPRYEAFEATPLPGLRVCARNHLHVDAFGRSPRDCRLDRYDDYAPICAADVPTRGRRRRA
jgi:hypothetical protein